MLATAILDVGNLRIFYQEGVVQKVRSLLVLCVYIMQLHAEIQIHAVIQQEKYSKYFFYVRIQVDSEQKP